MIGFLVKIAGILDDVLPGVVVTLLILLLIPALSYGW